MNLKACAKSWKTTGVGVTLIGCGILEMLGIHIDHITTSPEFLVLTGFGMVFAKDANIVGGKVKMPIEDDEGVVHLRDPDRGSPFR